MKKALILYDTVFGNTKKVAMAISRGLEAGGIHVDSSAIQDYEVNGLQNYDVIGIGGPTHFHGASKTMKSFLTKIKGLKMEHKQGFAFETKGNFRLAGSAAKRIVKYLKKMKLTIIHPVITAIVLDKEGPLKETTLDNMEQIGLNFSEKINGSNSPTDSSQIRESLIHPNELLHWNRLKWLLLGGGPLFFFIRALSLALTGGDCLVALSQVLSWFLLLSEIAISGVAATGGVLLWRRGENQLISAKIVLLIVVGTYILHLTRATLYIIICVL